MKLTDKEELYCQSFVLSGGKKIKAYEDAGYSMKMGKAKAAIEADKIFNRPNVTLRIKELQKGRTGAIIKSKEDKLLILEAVMEKCSRDDPDKGMINAPSVIAAIKEHNLMQGHNAPIETTTKDDTITKVQIEVVSASKD